MVTYVYYNIVNISYGLFVIVIIININIDLYIYINLVLISLVYVSIKKFVFLTRINSINVINQY